MQRYEVFRGLFGGGEGGEFAEGFGFGFVEEVGVDFCRGDVGVAHELLDSVDGNVLRQQQHAEGVAGTVEGDGFLYPGLFAPALQHHVDLLVGLFLKDIFATAFLAAQQGFRLGAQRQSLVGVGLLLVELQQKVLAVALHVLPPQTLHITVAQPCHAGKEEHRLDVIVLVGKSVAGQFLQLRFRQKTLFLLFVFGTFHPLQYAVVEESVLVGIVEDASQFLEV